MYTFEALIETPAGTITCCILGYDLDPNADNNAYDR